MGVVVGRKKNTSDGKLVCHYDVTSSLNYTLTQVEVLVVAGGGGAGGDVGGGGGGGGVLYSSSYVVTAGTAVAVTIGNGGSSTIGAVVGGNGQNSVFGNLSAIGGGGGSHYYDCLGRDGGSGGGGNPSGPNSNRGDGLRRGGAGTAGQGNRGGEGGTGSVIGGCAGGGAGGPGSEQNGLGSAGGPGLPFSISGTLRYYGGGGGAGSGSGFGPGGIGGGGWGDLRNANTSWLVSNGTANTGGGGGGDGGFTKTGAGGSGVVVVRYPGPQKATGGTITQVNGYTIHTFNSSGSFTPTTSSTIYGLYDLTEKGNHLQLSNTTYNTSGVPSLVFNGTSSNAFNYTATNPLTSNVATMILWIKPSATQNADTYNGLFVIGIKSAPYGSGYGETFLFSMKQNRTLSMAKYGDDSTNATNVVSSSSWSMVSCVKNGATTRFGVNTTFESTSNTGNANFRGTLMNLGCTDSPGRFYTGEIAVAMLFDTALSDSQITEIYNSYSSRFV